MINTNELRMNNYVYSSTEKYAIKLISLCSLYDIEKEPDYFNPIPISENWLYKFGFSMKFGTDPQEPNPLKVFSFGDFEIMKFEDEDNFFFSTGKGIHTDLLYVHHLQNLFFALKREELDFFSTEP